MAIIDNMISFWSIADASDSHGSNTLTNNGVSFVVVGPRTVGDFEASESDNFSIASNASLQTGDVSFGFAAAVVPETIAGFRTIVGKWSNTGNLREYLLGINAVTSRFEFSVSSNGTAFTTVQANSLGAPSNGSVYYVIAWHDATANTINIQVNNGTVDSAAHSTGVFTSTPTFYIGRTAAQGGVAAYFDGIIGLVGYWKGGFPTSDERTWLWNDGNLRDYAEILAEGGTFAELAGTSAGVANASADLTLLTSLTGAAAGVAVGTGDATLLTSLTGSAVGQATTQADLSVISGEAGLATTRLSPLGIPGHPYTFEAKTPAGVTYAELAGSVAGQATTQADLSLTVDLSGASAGIATTGATLSTTAFTIYASPSVADGSGNSGLTEGEAVSPNDAIDLCVPGTTVLFMDGTFQLTSSLVITLQGTETDWITLAAQHPGSAFFEWDSVENDPMFYLLSATGQHCCFIEINGLIFDGMNIATNGIFAQKPSGVTGFHPFALRFINNEIRNCGSAGIATIQADYITAIGNKIHHVGMVRGWGSGIALNTNIWADESPTFHNLILNNIISGVYDCCGQNRIDDPGDDTDITDGNGIIYDRSAAGNISPPVLIANNVIYMNGGRGILGFMAGNMWIINNTCYQNGLDLLLGNDGSGIPDIGDIQIGGTSGNNYVFNNIVHAWTVRHAYSLMPSSTAMWRRNLWFGGDDLYGIDPGDIADTNQFINGDPDFVDPPVVDPDDGGQYLLALDPDALTDEFYLQSTSPAIDYGIDPRTVTGQVIILPDTSEETDMTDIFAAMTEYLLLDAVGAARDAGGEDWDLGAYESAFAAETYAELAGISGGAATADANLTLLTLVNGAAAGLATAAGDLTLLAALMGNATGQSTTQAALHLTVGLSGLSSGVASTDADLVTGVFADMGGSSAGIATATGNLALLSQMAGQSIGIATAAGDLSVLVGLIGQANGVAATAGGLTLLVGLSGQANGIAIATGGLTTGTFASLSGNATGIATLTGDLTLTSALSGLAAGDSDASANLHLVVTLGGVSAGSSATIAILTSSGEIIATIAGTVYGSQATADVYGPQAIAVLQ